MSDSTVLQVNTTSGSYPIEIADDWRVPRELTLAVAGGAGALVVTDETVAALYSEELLRLLEDSGARPTLATIPPGENSKSLDQTALLYSAAIKAGLDRRSVVVALGGGVVGDLAGFAAATFLRGVKLVQFPTTLLAMVDSSVGGKTGVNLREGKNLAGAFHQPIAVHMNLGALRTLPYREFAAGMAEIVKYGAIRDPELLGTLEDHAETLGKPDGDPRILRDIVARCCRIKADVVAADEREAGERAILNFGHTLGHALEKTLGFGVWLHGEAVAYGMVYAARVGEAIGLCAEPLADRLAALCRRFGLPVDYSRLNEDAGGKAPEWSELREAMSSDKKSRSSVPRFVLCAGAGEARFGREVPEELLRRVWESGIKK